MSNQDATTTTQEEADYDFDARREELKDRYRFYIMNPAQQRGAEFSLWVREDGFEYPTMSSNTGGFTTFLSRSEIVGDGLVPTDEFFTLVGLGFHEAMCFMPDLYFSGDHFENSYNNFYDGKPRKYEVWAAANLIEWLANPGEHIPEFEPFIEWTDAHTEFGVPAKDGVPDDE